MLVPLAVASNIMLLLLLIYTYIDAHELRNDIFKLKQELGSSQEKVNTLCKKCDTLTVKVNRYEHDYTHAPKKFFRSLGQVWGAINPDLNVLVKDYGNVEQTNHMIDLAEDLVKKLNDGLEKNL